MILAIEPLAFWVYNSVCQTAMHPKPIHKAPKPKRKAKDSLIKILFSTPGMKWALPVAALLLAAGIIDAVAFNLLVEKGGFSLVSLFGTVGGAFTLYLLFFRLYIQDTLLRNQTAKEIDDRFNSAVKLLGSQHSPTRIGAIFSLHNLAVEIEKYRKQISNILCSHIRIISQKGRGGETEDLPSIEIQTAIDLLFKFDGGLEGLYCIFPDELPQANLTNANLENLNFQFAHCQNAIFDHANCDNSDFSNANCSFANFSDAKCNHAKFDNSDCQGVTFAGAECVNANFSFSDCQAAIFSLACCYGARFDNSACNFAALRGS